MPTYEYACKKCGEHLEVVQSFKDDAAHRVPELRRRAAQGVRQRRHRLQGQRLLQDRQPPGRQEVRVAKSSESKSSSRSPTSEGRRPSPTEVEDREQDRPKKPDKKAEASRARDAADRRRLRRLRLLLLPRRRRTRRPRHARTAPPSAPVAVGRSDGVTVAFLAPPRRQPRAPAAQGELAGQRVGDARARRALDRRPVRGRVAARRPPSRATWSCSTSSSTAPGAGRHVLRRAGARAHAVRRPVLPRAAPAAARRGSGRGRHRPRRRHRGRHPGPAVLDAGRVARGSGRRAGTSST